MNTFKHVIESQQFDLNSLNRVFDLADKIRDNVGAYQCPGKILATLFYEPSTRTRLSFETAMLRLGGSVISTEKAKEFSSYTKGESLEDTIKVISKYADIIALRHHEIGAAKIAQQVSSVSVINAGDGAGQHPTQALLDLYTIKRYFSAIDGLTISMVGDLMYGRTTRSLCYLLGRFFKVKMIFVAPSVCRMAKDILDFLDENGIQWEERDDFVGALKESDCVYMTRMQKERFLDMNRFEEISSEYRIDKTTICHLKEKSIVMHPLPRQDEINPEIDDDPRMVFFDQASNGIWIRMALITMLLNPELQQ